MKTIAIACISIADRQRASFKPGEAQDLAMSIAKVGLLHPPVLAEAEDGSLKLVAGERRLAAMRHLHDANTAFKCGDHPIPPGHTPYLLISDLTPQELMEAELDENIMRVDLAWQDRTNALARIHEGKTLANPEQTLTDTATDLIEASGSDRNVAYTRDLIAKAQILSRHMGDLDIREARSQKEAWDRLSRKANNTLVAELHRRKESSDTPHVLIHGDLEQELPKLPAESFDLILTDPPYGYDANQGWARQVQAAHRYDDSPQSAKTLAETIIREGFRITKPRANLVMFCHHDSWHLLREYAAQQGWTPWMRPIIWHKSNEGLTPWGSNGFRYCYEMLLWCTKGERGTLRPMADVIHVYKITRGKTHGAQKPVELFRQLISLMCLPGETVLDPCVGSGTLFPAATASRCVATGIEKEKQYVDIAQTRLEERHDDNESGVLSDASLI